MGLDLISCGVGFLVRIPQQFHSIARCFPIADHVAQDTVGELYLASSQQNAYWLLVTVHESPFGLLQKVY